jgi:hypothetical protein
MALKSIVNSPTVNGKAIDRTYGMQEIGGVPKVALIDRAIPNDIMLTPRTSIRYLIINFLSISTFPAVIFNFHLNLKGL